MEFINWELNVDKNHTTKRSFFNELCSVIGVLNEPLV